MLRVEKARPAEEYVLAIFPVLFSVARFFFEFIRLKPVALEGLTAPQLLSMGLSALACYLLARFNKTVSRPASHEYRWK